MVYDLGIMILKNNSLVDTNWRRKSYICILDVVYKPSQPLVNTVTKKLPLLQLINKNKKHQIFAHIKFFDLIGD